jgi:hypothetical protein
MASCHEVAEHVQQRVRLKHQRRYKHSAWLCVSCTSTQRLKLQQLKKCIRRLRCRRRRAKTAAAGTAILSMRCGVTRRLHELVCYKLCNDSTLDRHLIDVTARVIRGSGILMLGSASPALHARGGRRIAWGWLLVLLHVVDQAWCMRVVRDCRPTPGRVDDRTCACTRRSVSCTDPWTFNWSHGHRPIFMEAFQSK